MEQGDVIGYPSILHILLRLPTTFLGIISIFYRLFISPEIQDSGDYPHVMWHRN